MGITGLVLALCQDTVKQKVVTGEEPVERKEWAPAWTNRQTMVRMMMMMKMKGVVWVGLVVA